MGRWLGQYVFGIVKDTGSEYYGIVFEDKLTGDRYWSHLPVIVWEAWVGIED